MRVKRSELIAVRDQTGTPVKAQFVVESDGLEMSVIVESRGGSIGGPNERNAQYNHGLALLLARLAQSNCVLNDAVIDTAQTARMNLNRDQRRLLPSRYPISLANEDLEALRTALCAAQRPIGRSLHAKGSGNNTKRMRLYVSGLPQDVDEAAAQLAHLKYSTPSDDDLNPVTHPLRTSRGQGRGLTSEERRAVESRAMEVAYSHLQRDWEHVKDVSATDSCDFVCKSGDRQLYVEVKGTTGLGETVVVTRNEVALARFRSPDTLLIVVHGIQLDRAVSPVAATAGEIRLVHPWSAPSRDLEPMAFECRVPAATDPI
ncbi:MAG: hypothetical protein C0404_10220 [Verrucomicrobia bacterium]|nr:hypothetical protein [Verrucomicrobiota bacterium]